MRDAISWTASLLVAVALLPAGAVLASAVPAAAQDRGPDAMAIYRSYLEDLRRAESLRDLSPYMPAEMTALLGDISEEEGAVHLETLRQEAAGAPPGAWSVVHREERERRVSLVLRGLRDGSGALVQLEGDLTLVREEAGWKLENIPSWHAVGVLPADLRTDAAPRPLGPAAEQRAAGAYEPSAYAAVAEVDGSGASWEGTAAFDPRGAYVLLANSRSSSIQLLDVDGLGEVWTAPTQQHYGGASFRPDGRGLALLGRAAMPEVLPLAANLEASLAGGEYFFARPALAEAAAAVGGRVRWTDLAYHPAEPILALAVADHEDETRGAIVFQPTGDGLWLPGEPETPRVWDLDVEPFWITWAPTGDRLAWTSSNAQGPGSSVHVREYADGGRVLDLSHPAFSHPDLMAFRPVFSSDGRRVAAIGWDYVAVVWDATTGDVLGSMPGIARLAFAPDGEHVLAVRDVGMVVEAGTGDRILVWRIGAPEPVRALPAFPPGEDGLPRTVAALAVSPNGRFLLAVSNAGDVRLWDAEGGAGSADRGRAMQVASEVADTVDYTSFREARRWTPDGGARAAALDPTGTRVAYVPWDQSRTVVASLASGEVVGEIAAESPYDLPGVLAFSPAGDRLAIGGMGVVSVYEVPSMERLQRLTLENPAGGHVQPALAFGPYGNVLAATQGPAVHVLGVVTGETLRSLMPGDHGISEVAFSPDGGLLATYSDRTLTVWTEDEGRELSEGVHIGAFAFSPHGETLAIADREGHVLLFDARTGERAGGFAYGDAWVPSLVHSPDGSKLVTGGGDGVVRVWDPGSGELVASYPVGEITARAALSRDGSILLVQLHRGDVVVLRTGRP
jgi:WD40 repeat protein